MEITRGLNCCRLLQMLSGAHRCEWQQRIWAEHIQLWPQLAVLLITYTSVTNEQP